MSGAQANSNALGGVGEPSVVDETEEIRREKAAKAAYKRLNNSKGPS